MYVCGSLHTIHVFFSPYCANRKCSQSDWVCRFVPYLGFFHAWKLVDICLCILQISFWSRRLKLCRPYSQAVVANGFAFVSGQIPMDTATGQVVEGDIKVQTVSWKLRLRNTSHVRHLCWRTLLPCSMAPALISSTSWKQPFIWKTWRLSLRWTRSTVV